MLFEFFFLGVLFVSGILQIAAFGAFETLPTSLITTFAAFEKLQMLQIATCGDLERLAIRQITTLAAPERQNPKILKP